MFDNFFNYKYLNVNNIYNFIISIYDLLNDQQKDKLKDNIKLHVGLSFYNDLNTYYIKKFGAHF